MQIKINLGIMIVIDAEAHTSMQEFAACEGEIQISRVKKT